MPKGKVKGIMQLDSIGEEKSKYLVLMPEHSHHISMTVSNKLWKEHGWQATPIRVWVTFEEKDEPLTGEKLGNGGTN